MRACSSRSSDKCSLKSSDRLIQTRVTSYLNTTILFAFETIEFEIFKSTHARGNLSRQFSISILTTFPFSILEDLSLEDTAKSISSPIDLAVDSSQSSRESRTNEDLYLEGVLVWRSLKSYLFSNSLTSRNSKSCFAFYLCSLHDHSFEEASDCYLWESLACFIVLLIFHSINYYLALLWGSHWSEGVKSLLFYWFVEKWLFFFVVASSWFSTIIHLLFTFCDSLSNDKYERKRMTVQLRESVQSQEEESDETVQLRESVLCSQKKKKRVWQYRFEKAYCTVVSYSSSESASMTYL